MAASRVVVLLYILCQSVTGGVAESLTADVVFDVLSRRFDFVIREIDTVKSNVADIKKDVSQIEKRIENVENNVSEIVKIANEKEDRMSKPGIQDKLKRQSKALQKMLASEKTVLREAVDQLHNMFSDLQSDIKSQMSSMYSSVGNSIDDIKLTISGHIADTNATLSKMNTILEEGMNETNYRVDEMRQEVKDMSDDSFHRINEVGESVKLTISGHIADTNATLSKMNTELEVGMNETDNKVDKMRQEVKEMSEESLNRIKEVEKSVNAKATEDVVNAKNEFNFRINSEISKVTYRLTSLERKQERREDEVDGSISRLNSRLSSQESYSSSLSSRIYAEEERKVAFSARLDKKWSYYSKSEIIKFNDVLYSHGGGYDSSTGIFTAPKSGTYLFVYNIESKTTGDAHVVLKVRGYTKTSAIADKGPDNGGNAGIEYLWKGDKAWIETASLKNRYYIWAFRTTFNGILID